MTKTVNQEMNSKQIADIIFKDFNLHQSCSIRGFEKLVSKIDVKGEKVVEHIRSMDKAENFKVSKTDGRARREDNARVSRTIIGKYITQKAFKFEHTTRDGVPTTNIWRIQ